MYSEKTKKELIDMLRKEKEAHTKLKNKLENMEEDARESVSKSDYAVFKKKYNELVEAYQRLSRVAQSYQQFSESVVKSLQGLNGLSTDQYTMQQDTLPYVRYSNSIEKI
jgi:hypothetical protein